MYLHAVQGDYNATNQILEYAKDYQVNSIYSASSSSPTIYTYNLLLFACANSKNIEKVDIFFSYVYISFF